MLCEGERKNQPRALNAPPAENSGRRGLSGTAAGRFENQSGIIRCSFEDEADKPLQWSEEHLKNGMILNGFTKMAN